MDNGSVLNLLKDWGSAGMVIVVVLIFLKDSRTLRDSYAKMQQSFNELIGNHLTHSSDTLKETAQIMADALDRLNENCERRTKPK